MNLNTLLKSIITLVLLAIPPSMTTAATETITWIHTDHLGSPIAGRNDAGETIWEHAYAPWGEKQAVAGVPQAPAGVGYTGHVYDEQVGLIYAGARWYDPQVGRFLSPDIVRFELGKEHYFNRYAYGMNDPFMHIDPDGREVQIIKSVGGVEYSLRALSRQDVCAGSGGCNMTLSSTPEHMGLAPITTAGKTLYLSKHDKESIAYLNKVRESTLDDVSDAAAVATIAQPEFAPLTGSIAVLAAAGSMAYSDDPAKKIVTFIAGKLTGGGLALCWEACCCPCIREELG